VRKYNEFETWRADTINNRRDRENEFVTKVLKDQTIRMDELHRELSFNFESRKTVQFHRFQPAKPYFRRSSVTSMRELERRLKRRRRK
jgi:hypothetical protein